MLAHHGGASTAVSASPSPYELEARYCNKRDTQWVGYKLHLSETCSFEHPDLLTQVLTTPSTTPDCTMGPPIVQDLAARGIPLPPGTHSFDSGYGCRLPGDRAAAPDRWLAHPLLL